MRRNNTRNIFGTSQRTGTGEGTGQSIFIANPADRTPPRPLAQSVSTRLPIIMDFRQKSNHNSDWQYVSLNYIASEARTRSPVAGRITSPYTTYQEVMANSVLSQHVYLKSRSVSKDTIGRWSKKANGAARYPTQLRVMGEGAHDRIVSSAVDFDSSISSPLVSRTGSTPTNKSHWLHLIAYSLSDVDPQVEENLVAGSAGANYDHVIFENVILQAFRRDDIESGLYTVTAHCLPRDIAILIECHLELTLRNGAMKKISFMFDPTKDKLTDELSAAHDEAIILEQINAFIDRPLAVVSSATVEGYSAVILPLECPQVPASAPDRQDFGWAAMSDDPSYDQPDIGAPAAQTQIRASLSREETPEPLFINDSSSDDDTYDFSDYRMRP